MPIRCRVVLGGLLCALLPCFFSNAWGYALTGRWTSTALDRNLAGAGDAVRLTWSLVPDGTVLEDGSKSNLIAKLDGAFGKGPGGSNLRNRPWFPLVEESFQRWSNVGGVTLTHEYRDDGAPWGTTPGASGVRGDIRIGGHSIDGKLQVLGRSEFPSNGDIVIDTDDMHYFNSGGNHGRFRNFLMHELGHGLGLGHVVSHEAAFLLEPSNNWMLEGPQFDEILGLHQLYGDRFEKTNGGAGNDRIEHAVNLGAIAPGSLVRVGADASSSTTVVTGNMTDFVSVSNQYDHDYYSFRLTSEALTSIAVVPMGPTYDHRRQGGMASHWDTSAMNDLSLTLFDESGNQLALVDNAPKGTLELMSNIPLQPHHDYKVRISGSSHQAQMYTLYIAASRPDSSATLFGGDFNGDMMVDSADYNIWRMSLGRSGSGLAADANQNGVVDAGDYEIWKSHFGFQLPSPHAFLTGDYNRDGRVDAADYTMWRNSIGQTGANLSADGNRDNRIDMLDYLVWKSGFASGVSGSGALALSPVPVPANSAVGVAMVATAALMRSRRRSRARGRGATCL